MALQLTVLTLNIWGIPWISHNRKARIEAIGKELSLGKYDIVSLQEVWAECDNQLLQQLTKAVLPYSHYFYSGVCGSGLLVLSRFPIVTALFHTWSVNGYFHRIHHADWYGGKGVGLCRICVDTDQYVHLYNAHLHAEYDLKNDDYKTHRIIQAFDTAEFIEATRSNAIIQILAGDLNTQPHDMAYKILLKTAKLTDTCSSNAVTYENPNNSYTPKKRHTAGQRIDHILYRDSLEMKATVLEYSLPLPEVVPDTNHSFSDHEGVMVKLVLEPISLPQNQTTQSLVCNAVTYINNETDLRNIELRSKNNTVAMVNGGGKIFHNNIEQNQQVEGEEQQQQRTLQMQQYPRQEWLSQEYPKLLEYKHTTSVIEDAIIMCNNHLNSLRRDRVLYYIVALLLLTILFILLFALPDRYKLFDYSLKFTSFCAFLYCVFMAVLWNPMERHGILSGMKSMETKLNHMYTQFDTINP